MTDCISLRRGTSKLLELVPYPFDLFNKLCSKRPRSAFGKNTPLLFYRSGIFPDFILYVTQRIRFPAAENEDVNLHVHLKFSVSAIKLVHVFPLLLKFVGKVEFEMFVTFAQSI